MITLRRLSAVLALCASVCTATAGPEFVFNFKGTASQTNAAGQITSTPVSDRTILQDIAAAAGITDLSSLALVYHVQGNGMGDTVDVVNPNTGAVLDTVLGLYFGEAFGRRSFTNRLGTQERRMDYIYTDQNDHSLGYTLTTKLYKKNAQGNRTLTSVSGQMTWEVALGGPGNVRVYTGTFSTGKQLAVSTGQ